MESAVANQWVCQMAEKLTCEIIASMAGIRLQACPPSDADVVSRKLDAIHGTIGGDREMQVQFRAEPRMLARLAGNMIGGEPEGPEEVREYAAEFFNVLCGRFLSELHEMTHTPIQFFSIEYELPREGAILGEGDAVNLIYFISEQQEIAEFSWTAMLVEKLLRRKQNVNA